jgi:hypothetical protein
MMQLNAWRTSSYQPKKVVMNSILGVYSLIKGIVRCRTAKYEHQLLVESVYLNPWHREVSCKIYELYNDTLSWTPLKCTTYYGILYVCAWYLQYKIILLPSWYILCVFPISAKCAAYLQNLNSYELLAIDYIERISEIV